MRTNKLMSWMTAAVVLMVMSVSVAFAQQGQGQRRGNMDPKEMAQRTVDRMAERLKLNPEQKEKVYEIQLAQSQEMQKAFQNGGNAGDREAMRTRMNELRDKTNKQILEVLDENQKAEFKKMQEERDGRGTMQRRGDRSGDGEGRRGPRPGARQQ